MTALPPALSLKNRSLKALTSQLPLANSRVAIEKRAADGKIPWYGPLGLIAARTSLAGLAQIFVTLIFVWQRNPDPLRAGTAWWQVTGTLVDVGCLGLLVLFTRREGIRLRDLLGLDKNNLPRDILVGIGLLVLVSPILMIGGGALTGLLVYGKLQPAMPPEVMMRALPLWAVLYSRLVWWIIWSLTEQMTYNGYALPRLQVITGGRTWLALVLVGFGWAIQHSFLPFLPDLRVFLYLFIQMIPVVIVMQLLYLRFRRLPTLVVVHWGMDLFSAIVMSRVI